MPVGETSVPDLPAAGTHFPGNNDGGSSDNGNSGGYWQDRIRSLPDEQQRSY